MKKNNLHIRIDKKLNRQFDCLTEARAINKSELVRRWIEKYVGEESQMILVYKNKEVVLSQLRGSDPQGEEYKEICDLYDWDQCYPAVRDGVVVDILCGDDDVHRAGGVIVDDNYIDLDQKEDEE